MANLDQSKSVKSDKFTSVAISGGQTK